MTSIGFDSAFNFPRSREVSSSTVILNMFLKSSPTCSTLLAVYSQLSGNCIYIYFKVHHLLTVVTVAERV